MRLVDAHAQLRLCQRFVRGVEFGLELGLLALEQARRDGLLREAHLDQLVLAGFELAYQGGLGPSDLAQGVLADRCKITDRCLAACYTGDWHLHRGVVALDQLLKQLGPNVGSPRAGRAVDPSATEEVGVLAAVASRRDAECQAVAALAAVDAAAQVVLADPWALASDPLLIESGLDEVEGRLVDQRFMASVKDLFVLGAAPIDDLADVVAIAEQPLHDSRAERLGHPFGGRPGTQTETFQLSGKLRDGVFARGVELKGEGDEPSSIRVEGHDGDPPTVRQLIDAVEVAEWCRAIGAADAGLLTQPALDALARLHRLELVLSGDHALVEERGGAVVTDHRLSDGDELGSGLAHQLAGLPVVTLITRPTRQAPDDDVLDARRVLFIAAL